MAGVADKVVATPKCVTKAIWVFILVVAAEIIVLRSFSALKYMALRDSADPFDQALSFLPAVVKALLLTGSTALIALSTAAPLEVTTALFAARPRILSTAFNLTSFAALIGIFATMDGSDAGWHPALLRATPVFWISVLVSWADLVAPLSLWRRAWLRNSHAWAIVFFASVVSFHWLDSELAGRIGILLIKPTLLAAAQLYGLTGARLYCAGTSPEGYPICGAEAYFVEIRPACSGYEGMFLSATLLGVYFYLEPRKISSFQSALTILISSVVTFLLNAARLALLVHIGSHVSPEVAQEGFHTNFGLLSVVGVLVSAVASIRALTSPSAEVAALAWKNSLRRFESGATTRLLIPMIYFIGGSLFFGLFSGKFFWLYPLPVLAAIAGCIQIRTEIRGLKFSPTRTSFFLATATFLVWLFLVPVDPENVTVFQTSLFLQPFPITVLWLSARLFGAVIVVPLVEELAFRGAVNALLYDQLRWYWAEASARFGALILTAISFGLVHNDFLAGALAGVAFGIARWHRNELGDAVLCHALTNLMLSFYILISGEWSYWL